jgi:hypothetical protein
LDWEKPFLQRYEYEGVSWDGQPIAGQNNIIPGGIDAVRDPNDPDPNRRYKGQHHSDDTRAKKKKFAVSPDLFEWTWLEVPSIPQGGHSTLTYDEDRELFIITVKRRGPYGRSVCLTTSENFVEWSEAEMIFHADQVDQENGRERLARFFDDARYLSPVRNRPEEYKTDIYELAVFPYEGLYLGMPSMFHHSGKHAPLYENVDGRKTVELVSSRNLRNWHRVAGRKPFLELSPIGDGSAYDTGQLRPTNRPLVRNDELWFYYGSSRHRDHSQAAVFAREYLDNRAVCMAKLRLDGFCSLKGGIEPGSVLTKPVDVDGGKLQINVDSWRGRVRAEVLDAADGRPLSGYSMEESIPAVADSIDQSMRWKEKSDLSGLAGKTVRIRFWLLRAELYGFWFDG